MGRRRSSGLFETLVKSAFGFGTTVHYKKSFWGHKQKVVKHHDSGKKKTYTHGCGLFGNVTKTKTEQHGHTVEEGRLKKNFLWGATEHAKRADGTTIKRKYTPGFFKDHVTTNIDGVCNLCKGSGRFHLDAKQCSICHGSGRIQQYSCNRCKGTGQLKPVDAPCKKCGGSGRYSKTEYK